VKSRGRLEKWRGHPPKVSTPRAVEAKDFRAIQSHVFCTIQGRGQFEGSGLLDVTKRCPLARNPVGYFSTFQFGVSRGRIGIKSPKRVGGGQVLPWNVMPAETRKQSSGLSAGSELLALG